VKPRRATRPLKVDGLPSAYVHQTVGRASPRSVVIMPSGAPDTHFDEAPTEIS